MNKIEARKRIRDHVLTKGTQRNFTVTESFILHWWRLMNDAVFDGSLPAPNTINVKNFKSDTYAMCYGLTKKRYKFRFRKTFEDRKTFLTVLVHEMVHAYEWINCGTVGHGYNFYSLEGRVKYRVGLPLGKYVD